jgi:O-antigen/teichoic acid export membrane protein
LSLIPDFIRRRIAHRPEFLKIADNIGWLFFDKLLRMAIGLLVGVWVARYLGPEQFGLFSYALAFVALFGTVATLGLNSVVVRDLIQHPATADVTLATAFTMQVLGGLIAYLLSVMVIGLLHPGDLLTRSVVGIMGFCLVFKSSEVIRYWFESEVQSKYTVWVGNAVFLLIAGAKIGLIFLGEPLIAFAWLVLVETVLVAFGLLYIYVRQNGVLKVWLFQLQRARTLLRDSWPLILSAVAIMIYMRIDQIMLGSMIGNDEVGMYSAALQLSEVWYFIPMAIVGSIFPSIIDAKKQNNTHYTALLQRLFDLIVIIAVVIALPISLCSGILVQLLYGDAFARAGDVLAVHMWGSIFVFLGVASSNWFVLENLQKLAFYRTALGAVVNVAANIVLIPRYGAIGAAFGTLLSQIFAAYLFDIFNEETRHIFWMKTNSLICFHRNIRSEIKEWS